MIDEIRKIFNEKIHLDEKSNIPKNWDSKLRNEINDSILRIIGIKNIDIEEDNNLKEILNDFKKKRGFKEGHILGGKVELNPSYKELVCHNVNKLEFENFYPHLIKFLTIRNLIKLEDKYYSPFEYILNNKDKIHQNNKKIKLGIKLFINYLYGLIISNQENIRIKCENKENIGYFSNFVLDELYNKLSLNAIYCDTDMIYYGGEEKIPTYLIKEILLDYEIPYKIEKIDNCIFFGRKKYIVANKGDLKIYGFKSIQV